MLGGLVEDATPFRKRCWLGMKNLLKRCMYCCVHLSKQLPTTFIHDAIPSSLSLSKQAAHGSQWETGIELGRGSLTSQS